MGQLQSNLHRKNGVDSLTDTDSCEVNLYVPPEILVKVFSYLDVRGRGRAAQVCRAWRDIAYVPVLWRNVEVSRMSPPKLFDVYLRRGISRIKSPAEPFDRENWAKKACACDKYWSKHRADRVDISLDMMGELIYSRSDKSLVKLLKTTSISLRSLTVRYSRRNSFGAILTVVTNDCKNLVKLCFVNCLQRGSVDGRVFWNALRNLRQLRCLVLKDFYGVDDTFFESLVDDQPACGSGFSCGATSVVHTPLLLTEFHLEIIYGITDKSIKYIGQSLQTVIELKLLYCDQLTYDGLRFLSASKNLRRLTLWCPRTLFQARDWISKDKNGDCFPDLREGLSELSRCLGQLDSFIVVGCSYTSLEIMAKFSNVRNMSPRFNPSPDMRYTVIPPIKHILSVQDCRVSTFGANQLITGCRNRTSSNIRWFFVVGGPLPVDIRRALDYLETVISSENYWSRMLTTES